MSSSKFKTAMVKSSDLQVAGKGIDDEKPRRKFLIPEYLSFAMVAATRTCQTEIGVEVAKALKVKDKEAAPVVPKAGPVVPEATPVVPDAPLVVFVDCKGGGGRGLEVKVLLQNLISEDQVFDISVLEPFLQYGLAFLRKMDDPNEKSVIEKLRIMIAGGDGEVGKILRSFGKLSREKVLVPPIGIIPLGTGNDLSNSFGWGDSLPSPWSSAVDSSLSKAAFNRVEQLDSWGIKIVMKKWKKKKQQKLPDSLPKDSITQDNVIARVDMQTELPANLSEDGQVFYKYFSIGMDAQVEYDFHQKKKSNPSLAQGPIPNKLSYAGYSCNQGWFFTPCIENKGSRKLENILTLHVKKVHRDNWEEVIIPSSIRAITFLNIHNYGGGTYPWGRLKPEYLEEKKYYEARPDDGLLEIFGLKQGWHASSVLAQLCFAKHIAQAAAIKVEFRSNASFSKNETFIQIDGESRKVELHEEMITEVTIERLPFRPSIIVGDKASDDVTSKEKEKEKKGKGKGKGSTK